MSKKPTPKPPRPKLEPLPDPLDLGRLAPLEPLPDLPPRPKRALASVEIVDPDQPMSDDERVIQMWSVHPLDLDRLGFKLRTDFYKAHLKAAKKYPSED